MALNAHYRYSAAVEYAQSQWESVNNRVHHKMQEDGSVVLVDPNHQGTSHVEIQKIDPSARLFPFEVQPTDPPQPAAQHGAQITINKLGKSRMSPFEPSSSSVSAAHSSVPIGKKLDHSLLPFFQQPKVDSFNKVALSLFTSVNQFDHQVPIMINDINAIMVSAPASNIKPSTPSNVNDELGHHKRSSSISSAGAKRHSMADTISNAENCKEKAPTTSDTQQKMDLADFDAMVAELDGQKTTITKPQLIDAMIISLKLRKHIANQISSTATSTSYDVQAAVDLAHYDAMVAKLNEQELPISKAQLIDVFCASSKLRKQIKTVDAKILSQSGNKTIPPTDIQPTSPVASHQLSKISKITNKNLDKLSLFPLENPSSSVGVPIVYTSDYSHENAVPVCGSNIEPLTPSVLNANNLSDRGMTSPISDQIVGPESTKIGFSVPVNRNYNYGYNYKKQRQKERQEQIKVEQLLAKMDAYIASPNDEEMAVEPVIVNQPSLAAEAPIESSSQSPNCASDDTQQHPVIILLSNDDDATGEVHDEEQQQLTIEPILAVSDKKFRRKKRRRCSKQMNAVEPSLSGAVTIALPELVTAVDTPVQLVTEQLTEVQLAFMAECENEFVDRYTDNDQEYVELRKKQISHPPIFSFQHHQIIVDDKPNLPVSVKETSDHSTIAISADQKQSSVIPLVDRLRPRRRLLVFQPAKLTTIREVDESLAVKHDDKWVVGFFHEGSIRDVRYLYYTPLEAAAQLKAAEQRMLKRIEERRQVLGKIEATAASLSCSKSVQQQTETAVTVDDEPLQKIADDQSLSSVDETHQTTVPIHHSADEIVLIDKDDTNKQSSSLMAVEHPTITPIHHSADEIVLIDHPSVLKGLADDGEVQSGMNGQKKTKENEAAAVTIKASEKQAEEFGNETIVPPVTVNILSKPILPRFEEPSVSAAQPKVASAQTVYNFMVPTAASTAKRTSKFVAAPVNQGPAWNSSTKIDPKAYQKLPSVPSSYIANMKRQQKAIEVGRRSSPALP